jgi:hypothetical protein
VAGVAGANRSGRRTPLLVVGAALAAVAVVVLLVWRHDGDPGAGPEATGPNPLAPLTGLEADSAAAAARCAVSVKIGNTADARPQFGIDAADVVYEEVVESGITRLIAVYQSHAPEQVGSVRSVRATDGSILWPLRGVFAFSGGDAEGLASLEGVPVVALDEKAAGDLMFRGPGRAPHNLYARVDRIYDRCQDPAPTPLFTYRDPATPPGGTAVTSATVGFGRGYDTGWTWDADAERWQRSIFGEPDTGPDGSRVGAQNVVVMEVPYLTNPSGGTPEADMLGEGPVHVLTSGHVVEGTWRRPSLQRAAELVVDARPIPLTPGTTWVELLPAGNPIATVR